ncbi:hypothetical protein [Alteromonas sp. V450]|nr:hypothetical protein [Alteromonas sp. V450]
MKKNVVKLDVSKLYGFNLSSDKKQVKVSTAASPKLGIKLVKPQ